MRLKEVGKKLQLIRPVYIPEDRRTREKMIASVNAEAMQVPFDVAPLLTPEEIKQVNVALMKRYRAKVTKSHLSSLKTDFRAAAVLAMDALIRPEIVDALTPEEATDLWSIVEAMQFTMERVKLPRTNESTLTKSGVDQRRGAGIKIARRHAK